jgi:hypothetical protein
MRRYLTDPVLVGLVTYTGLMVAECVRLHRTLVGIEAARRIGVDVALRDLVSTAHATTTFN